MGRRSNLINKYHLPYRCETCGNTGEWQGGIITLQVHHKDGNHNNNAVDNLQVLCPNCHALTDSYCKNNNLSSFNESAFLQAIKSGSSVRKALYQIGLSDGSANYKKAYIILQQNGLGYTSYSASAHPNCVICGKNISLGAKYCVSCYREIEQRFERPSPEQLIQDIATSSFLQTGAKYKVSAQTIVKWCKGYQLPYHKKDIITLYQNNIPR